MFRRPSLGLAEIVWRWSFGAAASLLLTALFLEYFGLRGLEDLPAADELRRIPITRPSAPVTADPGLATTPPEQLKLEEEVKVQNEDKANESEKSTE